MGLAHSFAVELLPPISAISTLDKQRSTSGLTMWRTISAGQLMECRYVPQMSSRYFSSFLRINGAVVFVVSTGSAVPLCDSCFVLTSSICSLFAGRLVRKRLSVLDSSLLTGNPMGCGICFGALPTWLLEKKSEMSQVSTGITGTP